MKQKKLEPRGETWGSFGRDMDGRPEAWQTSRLSPAFLPTQLP